MGIGEVPLRFRRKKRCPDVFANRRVRREVKAVTRNEKLLFLQRQPDKVLSASPYSGVDLGLIGLKDMYCTLVKIGDTPLTNPGRRPAGDKVGQRHADIPKNWIWFGGGIEDHYGRGSPCTLG